MVTGVNDVYVTSFIISWSMGAAILLSYFSPLHVTSTCVAVFYTVRLAVQLSDDSFSNRDFVLNSTRVVPSCIIPHV